MHNSPQPRFPRQQQQQQRRRGTSNYNNRQNNNNWNRRDESRHSNMDYEEDMIKLPPSRLMTSREKEWLVKIQLMTLLSGDMNTTDFYYIVSLALGVLHAGPPRATTDPRAISAKGPFISQKWAI